MSGMGREIAPGMSPEERVPDIASRDHDYTIRTDDVDSFMDYARGSDAFEKVDSVNGVTVYEVGGMDVEVHEDGTVGYNPGGVSRDGVREFVEAVSDISDVSPEFADSVEAELEQAYRQSHTYPVHNLGVVDDFEGQESGEVSSGQDWDMAI